MSRMSFAKRLAVMLTVGGFLMGTAGNSYGASRVNLDRNDTVYNNVSEYFEPVKSDYQYQDDAVKIGYIVVGDDEMLLDDQTMGYIRRMLNAKFPGTRYPTKRITDEHMKYEMGRRNFGDKYVVTEAHDVLMKEFEKLENMYERIPVYGQKILRNRRVIIPPIMAAMHLLENIALHIQQKAREKMILWVMIIVIISQSIFRPCLRKIT